MYESSRPVSTRYICAEALQSERTICLAFCRCCSRAQRMSGTHARNRLAWTVIQSPTTPDRPLRRDISIICLYKLQLSAPSPPLSVVSSVSRTPTPALWQTTTRSCYSASTRSSLNRDLSRKVCPYHATPFLVPAH